MRRLLVKIGAWLAILLGLAMMLQPTAADWLTRPAQQQNGTAVCRPHFRRSPPADRCCRGT